MFVEIQYESNGYSTNGEDPGRSRDIQRNFPVESFDAENIAEVGLDDPDLPRSGGFSHVLNCVTLGLGCRVSESGGEIPSLLRTVRQQISFRRFCVLSASAIALLCRSAILYRILFSKRRCSVFCRLRHL